MTMRNAHTSDACKQAPMQAEMLEFVFREIRLMMMMMMIVKSKYLSAKERTFNT